MDEKGRVTVPKRLRESLGLRKGVRLAFEERNGELVARKAPIGDPIARLRGILPPMDVDEEIRTMRGPDITPGVDPERLDS